MVVSCTDVSPPEVYLGGKTSTRWGTIIPYCLEDEAASGKAEAAVAHRGPVEARSITQRQRNFCHPDRRLGRRGRQRPPHRHRAGVDGDGAGNELLRTVESLTDFDVFCAMIDDMRFS